MKTLVIGAAGHIGGNLVRELLERGRDVRVLLRNDTRAIDGLDVERVHADVLAPETLGAALDGVDVVYHLAAVITISGDRDGTVRDTNVNGPRNVVNACVEAGVRRMVHFSSIHAFNPQPLDEVIDEDRPLNGEEAPLAYDRTKAAGQREVLAGIERGLDAVIVHPTGVLGRNDFKPSRMGEVILMLCQRKFPALVDGGFNWVDVRDVVDGAIAAGERGQAGRNYLLSGHWCSFAELAALVGEVAGVRIPKMVSPMWLARIGAPFVAGFSRLTGTRPLYTPEALHALRNHKLITHARATEELGYEPHTLRETIEDTVSWFRANGML
ncbi:MAG: SDR family oxidoreductase [Deltaproteobacteria bacterium]|jgi:dihydroflavonol-4-reductase|nr:SDR family oxidoreductase [Deltaproteobacteria bacterium]